MLDNLKIGDKVMTVGGLYGEISALNERSVKINVAPNVDIELARFAINANITQDGSIDLPHA